MTLDQIQAIRDAADVLETEANELATVMELRGATLTLRKDDIRTMPEAIPHRIFIALRNEMWRLRKAATELRGMLPKTETEETE